MAKKLKPFPVDAIQFVGQPLEGFDRRNFTLSVEGVIVWEAISDTVTVHSGDWCVGGTWLTDAEFEKLYEPKPEPEPVIEIPEPEPVPEPVVEEASVAPEPAPVVEEPPVLSIGPPALDVDQGPMSEPKRGWPD